MFFVKADKHLAKMHLKDHQHCHLLFFPLRHYSLFWSKKNGDFFQANIYQIS